ncbi:MAG: glycosyltransferase [Bacteroidales bacterium]|nr:glycosyltransferase [Bacteroidales bacterium]
MKFSIIIPVYNRPDEIKELLESLLQQTDKAFEVIVVEDGSTLKSEDICAQYADRIDIKYFYKKNEKPAIARNYGMARASGDFFVFFDSDCIIPPHYFQTIRKELTKNYVDAYGGPDRAHDSFNTLQKSISYSMTSFLTTGGIRGGGEKVDKFYPRSFNLGLSKKIFEEMGGFPVIKMHPGEDMVLAIELIKRGYTTRLIKDAFVFHKRRTSLKQFYAQVFRFAKTRVIMSKIYPHTFKIFYTFPSLFLLGMPLLLILSYWSLLFIVPVALFVLLIFLDSLAKNKSLAVAFNSIISSFYQQFAYGMGFLKTAIEVHFLKYDEFNVFKTKFYQEQHTAEIKN